MGYSEEAIRRAFEIKREAKKKADLIYNRKLEELYKAVPEFGVIEQKKREIGSALVMTALSGDAEKLASLKAASDELDLQRENILNENGIKRPEPECVSCNDTGRCGSAVCGCIKKIAKEIVMSELSGSVPIDASSFENFNLAYYTEEKDENGVSPKKRMTLIYDYCKNYAESFTEKSESILFLGGAGLGKTHLSLAIAKKVTEKGYGVIYNTAQNLFLKLEDEYFSHSGNGYLDAVLDCDLLIIDDLGTEFATQFTSAAIYNIINTRILKGKPTVISTNLSFRGIEEKYTARVSSRMLGSYNMKKFAGADIRQIKLRENK